MADRHPLIANPNTNRIEELSFGDNLNLSGNTVSGITTISADKFIGNLKGVSDSSKQLIDASNILSGTISSQRLSGYYPISVNYANFVDAGNLINGTVPSGVLSGDYDINITGTAQTSNYLQNAANINEGIISANRLTGVYNISITGSSYNTEITSGIVIGKIDNNQNYYLNFSTPSLFDYTTESYVDLVYKDGNDKLVYNPAFNRLGIGTSSPEYNVDVVGDINATNYFGAGANIIGIVTTNSLNIGLDVGISTTRTIVATIAETTIDSFSILTFRSAKIQIQITQGTNYQITDLLVIHNGVGASLVECGSIATNQYLGNFSAIVSGNDCLVRVSMNTSSSATIKVLSQRFSI